MGSMDAPTRTSPSRSFLVATHQQLVEESAQSGFSQQLPLARSLRVSHVFKKACSISGLVCGNDCLLPVRPLARHMFMTISPSPTQVQDPAINFPPERQDVTDTMCARAELLVAGMKIIWRIQRSEKRKRQGFSAN